MTVCPVCHESKERVAQHWAMSGCGYPDLEDHHRPVLDGMILAGATVAGQGNNRHIQIGTTSERLAEWLADQLDWLCQTVRNERQSGERATNHIVRTPAHPELNRYERWDHAGGASGRIPPARFNLSPPSGRVWYAFAGGLEWTQAYDSTRQVTFSAINDDRREALADVLDRAGFEPTVFDDRIRLRPTVATEWLSWIGDPVPGVTHKWADSVIRYRAQRASGTTDESDPDYRAALARAALEVARERSDQGLTTAVFDARVDEVSWWTVASTLGDGSFVTARSVADVPFYPEGGGPPAEADGRYGPQPRAKRYSDGELRAALSAAEEATTGHLTKIGYDRWRDSQSESQPDSDTIRRRLGGGSWGVATNSAPQEPRNKVGAVGPEEQYSDDDLRTAVSRAREAVDGRLTVHAYRLWRNGDSNQPSAGTIRRRLGSGSWGDAMDVCDD